MWLFAGLGNPGAKYRTNRHNVGFMVVETIAQKYETFGPFRSKFDGEISEGKIGRTKILLLKPQTFMNLSGQSVVKAAHFYKIMPERIIVFHDELDLPPGEVRVKKGGGNAGHNGLKSLQESLSTPDFWRVRIGIGRPPVKGADVSNYVLGDFSEQDKEWLEEKLEKMSAQVSDLMSGNPALYEKNLKPKSPEVKLETNKKDEKNGL
ncbi:MAG: aminoacyl-tRNA hydrolase [Alphaproteobacteria bacterium]|nr:aminoacyl-tRNA hydrolase [Alphaproteobacteria bacterium]QQS56158.1 MAG: aminoacyl-tRNA hydrolase [Alphaproteobacteria bacterium]